MPTYKKAELGANIDEDDASMSLKSQINGDDPN